MLDWISRHHRGLITALIVGVISSLIGTAIWSGAIHFLFPKNSHPASDERTGILSKKEDSPIVKTKDEAAAPERKRLADQAIEQENRRLADEAARLEKDEAARAALAAEKQAEEQKRHEEASRQSALEEEARRRAALAAQSRADDQRRAEGQRRQDEAKSAAGAPGPVGSPPGVSGGRTQALPSGAPFMTRVLKVEPVTTRRLGSDIEVSLLFTNLAEQSYQWGLWRDSQSYLVDESGSRYDLVAASPGGELTLIPNVPLRIIYTFRGRAGGGHTVTVVLQNKFVVDGAQQVVVRAVLIQP